MGFNRCLLLNASSEFLRLLFQNSKSIPTKHCKKAQISSIICFLFFWVLSIFFITQRTWTRGSYLTPIWTLLWVRWLIWSLISFKPCLWTYLSQWFPKHYAPSESLSHHQHRVSVTTTPPMQLSYIFTPSKNKKTLTKINQTQLHTYHLFH